MKGGGPTAPSRGEDCSPRRDAGRAAAPGNLPAVSPFVWITLVSGLVYVSLLRTGILSYHFDLIFFSTLSIPAHIFIISFPGLFHQCCCVLIPSS